MNHTIRRLPDAELEVMQALWASDTPTSRAQLEEHLTQTHPMATTTLLTLLSRLNEKGFVRVDKEGRKEPQLHPEAVWGQPVHLCLGVV